MIGLFPDPLPDELLYSVCAQFADWVQYRSHSSVVRELFGTRNAAAVVDLPGRLGHLVAALPPRHHYTVDQLIDDHTLLPFYSPFCPPQRIKQVREDMRGANGTFVYGRLGILVSWQAQWLQFCPLCAEEDIRQFGECYWHRLHQVRGVKVCPVHAVFLEPSNVPFRHGRKPFELISARTTILVPSPTFLNSSNPHHSSLLKIARDAAWLLNQHQLSFDLEDLPRCYLKLLADCGLASYGGNVHVKKLNKAFNDLYTPEFLQLLMCVLDTESYNHWLLRCLTDKSNGA